MDILKRTHTGKTRCCEPHSVGAAFPDFVAALIEPQDVGITKKWYSAFTDTALQDELSTRGITHLYTAGLRTSVCVRATAEEAMALGFAGTVLEDCVGWRKYRSHQQVLRGMRERGIEVAPRHQALGRIRGSQCCTT